MTPDNPPTPSDEPRVSDEHSELLHYTSIDALRGLLESDTIWATHTEHLNDTSEMIQIVPSFNKACINQMHEWAKQQGWEQSQIVRFARTFGAAAARAINDALSGSNPESARVFVASFSTHKPGYIRENGMLSQWRGYGGSDGVAIVFDARRLEALLQQEANRFLYLWCGIADVVYDFGDLNLGDQFRPLVEELQSFLRILAEDADGSDRVGNNRLVEHLPPTMARVKHRAFSEEAECRIVTALPSPAMAERLRPLGQATQQIKSIHHRPGKQGSVPYIRLFEGVNEEHGGNAQLPITEVLVGPSRNQEAHHETVMRLVAQHAGPRQIDVNRSEIPFVGSS